MTDHHTEQRQAWLRTFREPTSQQIKWDIFAVMAGALAIILYSLLEG
jgi:hypothetical protein